MSAIAATSLNGVKIYNLASGKTLPQWLSQRKKRSLAKDEDYRRRVELVQDFHFPTASQKVKMSRDGNYIVATGTYPPAVKVYDVRDLSMKFERRLDCEVVQFEILSEDFGKLAFLQADRTIAFHAPYGTHYNTRVPKCGRDMLYHSGTCDLVIAASSPEIYRLNLDQGRFLAPLQTNCPAINVVKLNPMHKLLGAGGEDGVVECWDMRARERVGTLDVASCIVGAARTGDMTTQITALEFHSDGLTFGVGTNKGECLLFDLRSSKPLLTKSHQYGLPIVDLKFHEYSNKVLSTDAKIIKIWDKNSGDIFTNVECPSGINDICVAKTGDIDSGVLLAAGEQSRVMSYYIPDLGYAPKWCSFLDSITEELEEEAQASVYDDYKFVTRQELANLGLENLIGTNLLKAYMHGFFMDSRLYAKAKSVSEPFAYDQWRKQQIKDKVKEKQANRISIKQRLPKVNRALAERFLSSKNPAGLNPMEDDRFSKMFSSKDFELDEDSETFRLLHPNAQHKKKEDMDSDDDDDNVKGRFDLVSEEEEMEGKGSDESSSSEEDDEPKPVVKRKPQMYELGDHETLRDVVAFGNNKDKDAMRERRRASKIPLSERVVDEEVKEAQRSEMKLQKDGAVREMSFIPNADRKKLEERKSGPIRKKRGVKDLNLKKPWSGNSSRR